VAAPIKNYVEEPLLCLKKLLNALLFLVRARIAPRLLLATASRTGVMIRVSRPIYSNTQACRGLKRSYEYLRTH
jgi:hypothetical protein